MINEMRKIYQKWLDKLLITNVKVRKIHYDSDICFNSSIRETLYAIKKCIEENNSRAFIYFMENILGKAVIVRSNSINNYSLQNFVPYFLNYYYKRLDLIEKYFTKENILFDDLKKNKELLFYKYDFIKNTNLLEPITFKIITYLDFDYNSFMDLREKYELRKYK
tara:strand:+ start:142 stop:636 length:495 start_codon:yes stop_codon:yes gene_type:complete